MKYFRRSNVIRIIFVTLRVRVWIEMTGLIRIKLRLTVTLRVRVWIEINRL